MIRITFNKGDLMYQLSLTMAQHHQSITIVQYSGPYSKSTKEQRMIVKGLKQRRKVSVE